MKAPGIENPFLYLGHTAIVEDESNSGTALGQVDGNGKLTSQDTDVKG